MVPIFHETLVVAQLAKKFLVCKETKDALLCSEKSIITPQHHI